MGTATIRVVSSSEKELDIIYSECSEKEGFYSGHENDLIIDVCGTLACDALINLTGRITNTEFINAISEIGQGSIAYIHFQS